MYESIPIVPLRGLVVLPGELLHFDAGRDKSVRALQSAMQGDGMAFLSSQFDSRKNDIGIEDIYSMGTIVKLRQILNLPGDSMRVLVEGMGRATVQEFTATEPYYMGRVAAVGEAEPEPREAEALRRRLTRALLEYASISGKLTADAVSSIEQRQGASDYADAVANSTMSRTEDRQAVLEELDPARRMKLVLSHIAAETEIAKIDRRIQQEVKRQVDKNQKEYYLREQLKVIRKELGDDENSEADSFRERMDAKALPENVAERLKKEIDRFASLPAGSHETPGARGYIECLLDLPWTERTEDDLDIAKARKILDEDHYGLSKVKERIVEHIAVSRLTGNISGQIICFVGPPGVGKTSISESIARALGRKFVRMSLGGVRDEAEIRGHRRTYIGALPGRVIAAMRQAGTVNPVILFDEIDKLSSDYHGDPASAMLEVLDSAQNFAFRDHFLELPYDLSNVMFITTANDRDSIPGPLLDRMEVIEVNSYLENEKAEIAKRHLVPKQLKKHGLTKSMLSIPEGIIYDVIRGYTAEAGVRELEREIGALCRKAACEIGLGKERVRITKQKLHEYLGKEKYVRETAEKKDLVGMANGLAWTSVGGETLTVEALSVPGNGQVYTTGKLGDVMQESAKAALTFVRAHAAELGIDEDFLSRTDMHVHVPEGAVPKDGPSAGITMMTAMTSALTGIPVRSGVAMTGEITLRGRVLPIGGLREKLLAAVRSGMHTVIIPAENKRDLDETPEEVKQQLAIVYVSDAMSVLRAALLKLPRPVHKPLHISTTAGSAAGAIQ